MMQSCVPGGSRFGPLVRLAPTRLAPILLALALLARASSASCQLDPGDPYDPRAEIPRGPFKGRCLYTRELRSLRLLSKEAAAARGLPARPGLLYLANVRHADRFWLAAVDPRAVEAAIVQIEYFPAIVPAAHTQLRFRFAPGRGPVLVPQRRGGRQDPVRLRDLVYSVEAVPVVGGDAYDLVKGMEDHFGTAYRMVSLSDRYHRMVVIDHHRVMQLRLRLTPRERRDLFVHAVRLGDRCGMKLMYHTLARNCTTELVRVIDQTVAYSPWRSAFKNAAFFMCSIPTELPHTLRIRGLLEDGSGSLMLDLDRDMEGGGRRASRR